MTRIRTRANNNSGSQSNIDGKTCETRKKKQNDYFDMKKHQGQIEIATSREGKEQHINNPNLVRNDCGVNTKK